MPRQTKQHSQQLKEDAVKYVKEHPDQIIVIGVAAIVPHNAMADSLMDEISCFVEENTEVEILKEQREIV